MLIAIATLVHSLFRGRPAPANPWGANTLEWHCPSPPPTHNFADSPAATSPYDFSGLEYVSETEGYVKKGSHG
jgi:cytochrome c oxidase subunit 1